LIPAVLVSNVTLAVMFVAGSCLAGLAPANIFVILQGCAPAAEVGIWTGIQNFTGNLSGIVAPAAMGFLIATTGSYVPGFALGGGDSAGQNLRLQFHDRGNQAPQHEN